SRLWLRFGFTERDLMHVPIRAMPCVKRIITPFGRTRQLGLSLSRHRPQEIFKARVLFENRLALMRPSIVVYSYPSGIIFKRRAADFRAFRCELAGCFSMLRRSPIR